MLQLGSSSSLKRWPMDGTFGYSKCRPNNANEGVFLYKTSSNTHSDRTTKICRPRTQQLLHNLKQSLLWSNLSMSQNLFHTTFIEWYNTDYLTKKEIPMINHLFFQIQGRNEYGTTIIIQIIRRDGSSH